MKTLSVIGFLLVVMWGCSSQKGMVHLAQAKQATASDSTEYELIVFDPMFETWFVENYSPAKDHSDAYYHVWNIQYVIDWNYHFMAGHFPRVIENYIDYDASVDYGIELNRKLYYYFRYVETYLKVPILLMGPKQTT
ncbi:MAG: DUF6146 family protein [Bacteroidota bacterium]|nr:DUF6146 family protein [Bacteroidota bacterium]